MGKKIMLILQDSLAISVHTLLTLCYYSEVVENNLKRHPFPAIPAAFGCLKAPVGLWLWCVAHKPKVFGPLSYSHALKCKHILKNSEVAPEGWALDITP